MGEMPYKIPDKKKKENVEKDNVEDVAPVPRVYSQEEVDNIIQKREQAKSGGGDDDEEFGMNPKLLKSLQSTVGVFNALKEFASNPLTRSIETKIGERAAAIVDQSFGSPSHGGDKKDLLDMVLNSQMAYGFGQGLGARGPEFVESLGKTFGKERIDKFADNMLDQYGRAKAPGSGGGGDSSGNGVGNGGGEARSDTSKRDLLLTLDPNNPEHVAAYADSQDGISIDLARKMLRAHQDDFIQQMQAQGLDVSGFNKKNVQENEEMVRLKREQEEMLRVKRELDKQIAQLDQGEKAQSTSEASWAAQPDGAKRSQGVVSFKDIKGGKQESIDKVAEIPDKWGNEDLNNKEIESIENAERERLLANIKNSTGSNVGTSKEEINAVDTVVETVVDPIVEPVVETVLDSVVAPEELNFVPENDVLDKDKRSLGDEVLDLSKIETKVVKNNATNINTAMCPKCRKIKVLFDTEKGKLCEACKQKRGL